MDRLSFFFSHSFNLVERVLDWFACVDKSWTATGYLEWERDLRKFPPVFPWEYIPVHVYLFLALLNEGQTYSTELEIWGGTTWYCMWQANLASAKEEQHLAVNDLKVSPWFFNAISKSLCTAPSPPSHLSLQNLSRFKWQPQAAALVLNPLCNA